MVDTSLYGWLEVGERFVVDAIEPKGDLSFLADHAHMRFVEKNIRPNLIYVGSRCGLEAGLFAKESEGLVLTSREEPACNRSMWQLPLSFETLLRDGGLSYHRDVGQRLQKRANGIVFESAKRGQEFVFDSEQLLDHFRHLISTPEVPEMCAHEY
jgi:Nucleotide modification associated domain 3